jgi:hypothetical protein
MNPALSEYPPHSEQTLNDRKREPRSLPSARADRDTLSRDIDKRSSLPRRAPRVSVVVVLLENHPVSAASLTSLRKLEDQEVDVIVACAGQPSDLDALQGAVRSAQIILAPAGTSAEDLRELAMQQAAGDIVTLLNESMLTETHVIRQKLFRNS